MYFLKVSRSQNLFQKILIHSNMITQWNSPILPLSQIKKYTKITILLYQLLSQFIIIYTTMLHYKLSLSFKHQSLVMIHAQNCTQQFSFSPMLSAAYFLCDLFKTDSSFIATEINKLPILVASIPQKNFKDHPTYIAWNLQLKNCLLEGKAVSHKKTLFFDIRLEEQLKQMIPQHRLTEFKVKTVKTDGDLRLQDIFNLPKIRRKPKTISILSNTDETIKPSLKYLDAALFMGQMYNNEQWVYFNIPELPFDKLPTQSEMMKWDAVVLPGSPRSPNVTNLNIDVTIQRLKNAYMLSQLKIVGICFGHQLIAKHFGSIIERQNECFFAETVKFHQKFNGSYGFLQDLQNRELYLSSCHKQHVVTVPEGFEVIASSKSCEIEAMVSLNGRIFAMQFHPEYIYNSYFEKMKVEGTASPSETWDALKARHIQDSNAVMHCVTKFLGL